MHQGDLALHQAPPPGVTMPFLVLAPWFAVAAGALLAFEGAPALASRWSPGALAIAHLLTAGFMLQAMCGALLQFTPVVVGARIPQPCLSARLAQLLMLAGAPLLAFAFITARHPLLLPAAALLGTGIGVFLLALAAGLWRAAAGRRATWPLWVAALGLAATAGLGAWLSAGLGAGADVPLIAVANLHASWGLGGWAMVLLIAVAAVVVPMLQLTPRFPPALRALCIGSLIGCLGWATLRLSPADAGMAVTPRLGMGLTASGVFAVAMLWLLARGRRATGDVSAAYLRVAMLALLALTLWWLASATGCPVARSATALMAAAVLAIVGVFVAAISGMLYKIVPFMLWLSLSRRLGVRLAPVAGELISRRSAGGQFRLFAVAACVLMAAIFVPSLARIAGALFSASSLWLARDIGRAVWLHQRAVSKAG